MRTIERKNHKIGTYEVNKRSLSCFDDNRFVLDNSIFIKIVKSKRIF